MANKELRFILYGEDKTASKAMKDVEKTSTKVTARIGGAFATLGGTIGGEFGDLIGKAGEGITSLGEHSTSLGTKMTAAGGIATGLGAGLLAMGSKSAAAENQLAAAIKTTGGSFDEYKSKIEEAISTQERFGHTEDDTQNALRKLTSATHSPTTALKDMTLVSNLAAASHISLTAAAGKIALVYGGSGRILKQYGITTKDTGLAISQLSAKLKGQAAAAADTFGGRVDAIKAKVEDFADRVGKVVGPALVTLGPIIMGVGAVMESGMIPAIGRAIVAFGAWSVSMITAAASGVSAFASMVVAAGVWAAEMVVDAAIAMAPFLPIIAVVAAVGFAAYELYSHWKQVWGAVKSVAVGVWHWMVDIFHNKVTQVILAVGMPLVWLATHWSQAWSGIKTVTSAVVGWIGNKIESFIHVFTSLPGRIAGIGGAMIRAGAHLASSLWHGLGTIIGDIGNLGKSLYNGVVGGINWLIDKLKNWHFTIGVGPIHHTFQPFGGLPDIPMLAKGGVVTRPTLVMAGEAGPEAIVPLSKAGGYGLHNGDGGGSHDTYHIHLGGVYGDPKMAARVILTELQRLKGGGTKVNLA